MRKIRRKREKEKNKIIIISVFLFLIIMTSGYAAFSTNITLIAKGNIKCNPKTAKEKLLENIVTAGSGIYVDTTENNRYIYRGVDPNNYIVLSNELYRIISLEADNKIKVIKETSIGTMKYDSKNERYSSSANAYCNSTLGCNAWANNKTTLDETGKIITQITDGLNDTLFDLPDEESYLNEYLNNNWYNTLDNETKKLIVNHVYNIGPVLYNKQTNQTLETDIAQEKKYKWTGKIGLMNVSDFVKASNNPNCTSVMDHNDATYNCPNDIDYNYLIIKKGYQWQWLLNPLGATDNQRAYSWNTGYDGKIGANPVSNAYQVRPAFYITADINLCGSGTESNPYTIVS